MKPSGLSISEVGSQSPATPATPSLRDFLSSPALVSNGPTAVEQEELIPFTCSARAGKCLVKHARRSSILWLRNVSYYAVLLVVMYQVFNRHFFQNARQTA